MRWAGTVAQPLRSLGTRGGFPSTASFLTLFNRGPCGHARGLGTAAAHPDAPGPAPNQPPGQANPAPTQSGQNHHLGEPRAASLTSPAGSRGPSDAMAGVWEEAWPGKPVVRRLAEPKRDTPLPRFSTFGADSRKCVTKTRPGPALLPARSVRGDGFGPARGARLGDRLGCQSTARAKCGVTRDCLCKDSGQPPECGRPGLDEGTVHRVAGTWSGAGVCREVGDLREPHTL